ncbi:MAG: sulfatase [Trueperaceae bacterium]|nr:sulfatase [Trueperaceae bacterium]
MTPPDATPRRANLVLIDAHDLGRHLGCYGRDAVPSDALDGLAARGVRFAQAWCTAPQCSPSRAAMYTGRHAHDVGMLGLAHPPFDWRLRPGARYLAARLQEAGWNTHHVGIQHVTRDEPAHIRALGFDTHAASHAPAGTVADAAVDVLRDAEGPFFLNVGFHEPHRDARGRFEDHPPYDERGIDRPPYLPDTPAARAELAGLQGSIRAMDAGVGRILDALDARDDADDTWVVFTTDHGLALPRAKASMYDAGLEVALLMRWPARGLVGGRVVEGLVSHVDLLPTLLEGLGVDAGDGLHGRSLWPLLRGEVTEVRQEVFAEKTFHTAYEPQRAVRTPRHKLIANLEVDILNVPADTLRGPISADMVDEIAVERPPLELFDLQDDPLERRNVVDDPRYASVRAELTEALVGWMRRTGDPLLQGPVASPFHHAARRALGLPAEPDPYA